MSVRKEYQVLISGECVFSGSYAACSHVYDAFHNYFMMLLQRALDNGSSAPSFPDVLIAFKI